MRMIFVNLPVKDLDKAKAFYTSLGFSINEQFTDENASCVVISESIYVMLLTEPFFSTFGPLPIADATKTKEVLLALSVETREEADQFVDKALAAGGKTWMPANDMGFMYGTSFQDLDGHVWELSWMDPAALAGDA